MADTTTPVPIPRTLETPPRTTGNAQQDLPILIDWFYRAYQVIQQSVAYINSQVNSADVSFTNLPDPSTTTLAQAQQTANDAFSLANQADLKANVLKTRVDAHDVTIAAHTADLASQQGQIDDQQALWDGLITGTVNIPNASTGFTVTFGSPQPDTDYLVIVQAYGSSGTPPIDAFVVKQKVYAADHFDVILFGAPGGGNSVDLEWQLIRNT